MELDPVLARMRVEELHREADRARLAPRVVRRGLAGWRRAHVTIEVHLSPELGPEQVDQIFASLARHLAPTERR